MATSTMTTEVKHFTGWAVAISVLMIVAGILAIGLPLAAGIAVNIVVAWLLVFAGVGHLWFAWELRRIGGMVWQLLLGVLYVGVGIYLLAHPVAGLLTLTLAFAIYLFVEGVLELILAFQLPARQARGWLRAGRHRHIDSGLPDLENLAGEHRVGHRNARGNQHDFQRLHAADAVAGRAQAGKQAGLTFPRADSTSERRRQLRSTRSGGSG